MMVTRDNFRIRNLLRREDGTIRPTVRRVASASAFLITGALAGGLALSVITAIEPESMNNNPPVTVGTPAPIQMETNRGEGQQDNTLLYIVPGIGGILAGAGAFRFVNNALKPHR